MTAKVTNLSNLCLMATVLIRNLANLIKYNKLNLVVVKRYYLRSAINNYYNKLRATNILSNFFNLSSIQVSNILLLLVTIRIITGRYGINGYGLVSAASIYLRWQVPLSAMALRNPA